MTASAAMAALVLGMGVAHGEPDKLAAAFGAREDVGQASLSPDGTKLAFIRPTRGQGAAIMTLDLTNQTSAPVAIAAVDGKPERLSGCRWVGSSRLMCTVYGIVRVGPEIAYSSRIIALDADGKRVKGMPMPRGFGVALSSGSIVDWNPGVENSVLMMRQQLATRETGSLIGDDGSGYRIDRVDTVSLKASTVERADANAREYYSDGQGRIRVLGRAEIDSASGCHAPSPDLR